MDEGTEVSDDRPNYEGCDCGGEHRTVGPHRAWCLDCGEWCYPSMICERRQVRLDLDEALLLLGAWQSSYTLMTPALQARMKEVDERTVRLLS